MFEKNIYENNNFNIRINIFLSIFLPDILNEEIRKILKKKISTSRFEPLKNFFRVKMNILFKGR